MRPTREEILRLSVAERLDLIGRIWDTIRETPDECSVPAEHERILKERLASYARDPRATLSWDEVRKRAGCS